MSCSFERVYAHNKSVFIADLLLQIPNDFRKVEPCDDMETPFHSIHIRDRVGRTDGRTGGRTEKRRKNKSKSNSIPFTLKIKLDDFFSLSSSLSSFLLLWRKCETAFVDGVLREKKTWSRSIPLQYFFVLSCRECASTALIQSIYQSRRRFYPTL